MKLSVFPLVFLFCAFGVLAKNEPEPKVTALEGSFAEQKATIEKDIRNGITYKEIQGKDLMLVRGSLEKMTDLLTGVEDVGRMSEADKIELINHQNLVNTVLTMAENDSRVVCQRRRSTGTNFKTTTCETIRARRKRQSRDRARIETMLKSGMAPQDG